VLAATAIASAAQSRHESIEGHWQGALVRHGSVQMLKADFFKEGAALKVKFEMAALPHYDLPATAMSHDAGRDQFETAFGKADMTLDPEMGEMIGSVGGTSPPITIHLRRTYKALEPPVKMEEVQFRNGDVQLAGTLVLPATPGPHPAIVWIHGRGRSGRGQFRAYAKIFARHGVASLIYDKRGAGSSTGDHDKSGMQDFAGDALAAVELLATRKEVDARQIGLHGNSAGGWVAPIVAARSRVPVAFVMTDVGPADSVRDQQIHVAKHTMLQSGINFTEREYEEAARHMGLVQDFAYTGKGWDELRASVVKAKQSRWARFVDLPESESYEDIVWVRLNQYDPGPDLKKITVPLLAFYGERDYVVPPQENVAKLESYLKEAGNKDFKVVVFQGADHGLTIPDGVRRVGQERPEKYYWLWRRLAPGVVETKLEWLLGRVNVAKPAAGR
jgi:dienelactone hydrolase